MRKINFPFKKAKRFITVLLGWMAVTLSGSLAAQSITTPTTYTTIGIEDSTFSITTTNTDSWYKFTSTNSVTQMDIAYSTVPGMDSASLWVQSGSVITYLKTAVRMTDLDMLFASGLSSSNVYWLNLHKGGASSVTATVHSNFRTTTAPVACNGCAPILYDSTNTCQLICNGGFDYNTFTPVNLWGIAYACPWVNVTQIPSNLIPTPDLFASNNATTSPAHIPNNTFGWQNSYTQNSVTGYTGYAGIVTYWGGDSNNPADPDYREYLQIPLNSTLLPGRQYKVSFRISKAEKAKWASKNIGAWVSTGQPTQANGNYMSPVTPQANYSGFMDDTANWVLVSNTFTAAGTENWLTIGQFTSDAGSVQLSTHYSGTLRNGAYYYIDDVQLVPYPDSLNATVSPSTICNGDTIRLIGQTNLTNAYYWTWLGNPTTGAGFLNNHNDTVRAIPTDTVIYTAVIHLPNYNGCTIHDTVGVKWKPGPTNCSAGNDVTTCLGGSVTLTGNLGTPYGNYGTWTTLNNTVLCTNCTTTTITAPVSGDYIFISAYSNSATACKDRDTVHVTGNTIPVQIVSSTGMATCYSNFIPFMTTGTYSTYSWTTNAPSSSGATNDTLMAMWNSNTTTGTVSVTVTDANGCIGYGSVTVPTCCTTGAEEVLVNTNTTANPTLFPLSSGYYTATGRNFNINGVFHVNANTKINTSYVKFGPNAKIIIDPGFKLEINASHLYACSDMWDGMYVDGTNSNSEIKIINGSSVQDAKNAIVSTRNGKFTIDGTLATVKMNKNNIGVLVKPYQGTHSGTIKKAIISCDSPTQTGGNTFTYAGVNCRAPINGKAFAAVLIDSCSNITIGDSALSTYRNLMERQKYGIYSMNSNVKVWNNDLKYYTAPPLQPKNSPVEGVAIYAKGLQTLSRTLTVGRVGTYKAHNLIRKCSYGVMVESYMNLNCEYNRIDSISGIGVYSLNNQYGKTILINRDSITEFTGTGVNCTNVKQSTVTITNNQFNETSSSTPTSFGYTAIYVANAANYTFSTVKIQSNTIKRVRNGIWVMNVTRAQVLDNGITFYPNQVVTVQAPAIGIKMEAAHSSIVRNNIIANNISGNPASTTFDRLFGIHVTLCINDTITKNQMIKCGSGLFVKAANNPILIGCNTFTSCYYGANFGYTSSGTVAANISDQLRWLTFNGTPTPTGNTWSGTVSGQDLKGKISPTKNWWCNGSCPNTTGMAFGSLTGAGNTAINLPSTPNQCAALLNPITTGSATDVRSVLLNEICKTPRTYDTLTAQYRYIDSVFAYRTLKQNPSWNSLGTADDTYYSSWKTAVSSTNVGTFAAVEDSIQSKNLAAAASLLASINPVGTPESNRKAVLEVYLNSWAKDSMNLDSVQTVILTAIANQAPVTGGIAVYDARAMLFVELHDSSALRLAPQEAYFANGTVSHVYPNPTSGNMMLNYELEEGQSGTMQLYDISGRIVSTHPLIGGTQLQQFDVSDLPAGLYFFSVYVNGNAILSEKVIIMKPE